MSGWVVALGFWALCNLWHKVGEAEPSNQRHGEYFSSSPGALEREADVYLLQAAAQASFEARIQGVSPEHEEQHQNQNYQQGEHQQEEDEQAVSEGVVWDEARIVRYQDCEDSLNAIFSVNVQSLMWCFTRTRQKQNNKITKRESDSHILCAAVGQGVFKK